MPNFGDALLWYLVFLYSTVCHEAAHAWAALKLGDDTAYRGGQVSLDPLPHIKREPFGMVIIPVVAFLSSGGASMFGWASAPYDPEWALRYPRRSAIMAMAGPAANLALVLAAALLLRVGFEWQWWEPSFNPTSEHLVHPNVIGFRAWLSELLSVVFSLNLLLFVFNLLPLPPLDGSNVPLLFLNGRAAESYMEFLQNPMLRIMGLLLAWRGFQYLFGPIQQIAEQFLIGAG